MDIVNNVMVVVGLVWLGFYLLALAYAFYFGINNKQGARCGSLALFSDKLKLKPFVLLCGAAYGLVVMDLPGVAFAALMFAISMAIRESVHSKMPDMRLFVIQDKSDSINVYDYLIEHGWNPQNKDFILYIGKRAKVGNLEFDKRFIGTDAIIRIHNDSVIGEGKLDSMAVGSYAMHIK